MRVYLLRDNLRLTFAKRGVPELVVGAPRQHHFDTTVALQCMCGLGVHVNATVNHERLTCEVTTFVTYQESDQRRAIFFGRTDAMKWAFSLKALKSFGLRLAEEVGCNNW